MKETEVLLTLKAVDSLRKLRGTTRQVVIQFLDELIISPDKPGEFTEVDGTDRRLQVKLIGSVSIVYWHDSPIGEVKVLRIAPLSGS